MPSGILTGYNTSEVLIMGVKPIHPLACTVANATILGGVQRTFVLFLDIKMEEMLYVIIVMKRVESNH